MQKHSPLKAIDLELRVREALYARLSPEQLQALNAGEELDLADLLESIAYDVTPRIAYPQTPAEVVMQLAELALDCPTLLSELPLYIAVSPDRQQHVLISNTPLKSLYVNVLDHAIRFGQDELERLACLEAVPSEQARTLLHAMEKAYVEEGKSGGFWMGQVQQCLGLPISWETEEEARACVLAELLNLGLIKRRGSRAEIYDLTMEVKVPLVKKHRLWEKWDEYHRDEEAIAFARTTVSFTPEVDI
jgi:hypothetical protein